MDPFALGSLTLDPESGEAVTEPDSVTATGTFPVFEAREKVFQADVSATKEKAAITHPTTRRNEVRAFPFHPAASPRRRSPGAVPSTKVAIATAPRRGSPARMTASSTASVNPHGKRKVSAPIAAGADFAASPWENRRLRLAGSGTESAGRFGKSPVMEAPSRRRTMPVTVESIATNVSENLAAVPRSPRKKPPTA